VAEQFPKVVEAEKANLEELVANAHSFIDQSDVQEVTFFNKYFEVRRNLLDEYERNGMPRELQLRTIVESDMPQVRMAMLSMTWQFFVAPDDHIFVTADNPVHTLKGGVGFTKPYSELTFPVSSRVVLVGSYRDVQAGYLRDVGTGQRGESACNSDREDVCIWFARSEMDRHDLEEEFPSLQFVLSSA